MNTQPETNHDPVPHIVAALLEDGQARVIWADTRGEAMRLIQVFKSGALGSVVSLCFGEAHDENGREEAVESIRRRLQRDSTLH